VEDRHFGAIPCRFNEYRQPNSRSSTLLTSILGAILGTLFVVATPIGNLGDITARALRVLQEVSLIAAEDTRHTGRLLAHFGIDTPVISYHSFNERSRRERLLAALGEGDVALVSDAGTPAIADPGQDLVSAVREAGFDVVPIPGPSSLTAAISVSGLIDGPFLTLGFLPRKGMERATMLAKSAASGFPVVIFEAPSRVVGTLSDLLAAFGNRQAFVARELTKLHEDLRWGGLHDLAAGYSEAVPKGEIVIIVAGNNSEMSTANQTDAESIMRKLIESGMKPSEVAREAATMTGLPKSGLYELAIRLRKKQS
jgi:16S rRNA (cytidine1402-2'-O)-methyltransferase